MEDWTCEDVFRFLVGPKPHPVAEKEAAAWAGAQECAPHDPAIGKWRALAVEQGLFHLARHEARPALQDYADRYRSLRVGQAQLFLGMFFVLGTSGLGTAVLGRAAWRAARRLVSRA
jgi:hypothetical protein